MMRSFDTDHEAKMFVRDSVDVPIEEVSRTFGNGISLHAFSQDLSSGAFTNIYDISYPDDGTVAPSIELFDAPVSVYDHVANNPDITTASAGGFFFLADQASSAPRHASLNLSLKDETCYSLPVVDREAVVLRNGRLSTEHIKALGSLTIEDVELSWSGSLSPHEADVTVYGNGNSVIAHIQNDETGSLRALDEHSRYTPIITDDEIIDIGFMRREDGLFIGTNSSHEGGLDIFNHDVVMRFHERYAHSDLPEIRIRRIGGLTVRQDCAAFTCGPDLDQQDFMNHPINTDLSLGGKPPFLDVPLARSVLYGTADGAMHIRLYDGRPGSPVFPGVTPEEARILTHEQMLPTWGCFLDPGQTAKIVARHQSDPADLMSYGNSHYLRWPRNPGEKFLWTPQAGRPVASMITLR